MSKAIRSYPKSEQAKVIARRLASKSGGLGYLSAKDAVEKGKAKAETEREAEPRITDEQADRFNGEA